MSSGKAISRSLVDIKLYFIILGCPGRNINMAAELDVQILIEEMNFMKMLFDLARV